MGLETKYSYILSSFSDVEGTPLQDPLLIKHELQFDQGYYVAPRATGLKRHQQSIHGGVISVIMQLLD